MKGTWKEIKEKLTEKKENRRKMEGNERKVNGQSNGEHRKKEK